MLSLIFGYIATVTSIIGFQLKKQKQIIISQFIANAFVALSYFFLGPEKMAGGAICMVGAVQTLVNYMFIKNNNLPPKKITAGFLVAYTAAFVLTIYIAGSFAFPYDVLPFAGSLIFLLAVSTNNSKLTRMLFFANITIFILYDCISTPIATANLLTHICILISVIVGIVRYDILKKAE